MRRRARWLVWVLAALTALAACGGGDGEDSTGGEKAPAGAEDPGEEADAGGEDPGDDGGELGDGCEIVTAADGEAVLGEPVEQQPGDTMAQEVLLASCIYGTETETSFKLLQLNIFDGPQFFTPDIYRSEEGFEEVDGLGDGAFLVEVLGLQLQVLDGDRTIILDASGFNVDDADFTKEGVREELLGLAERVLERT